MVGRRLGEGKTLVVGSGGEDDAAQVGTGATTYGLQSECCDTARFSARNAVWQSHRSGWSTICTQISTGNTFDRISKASREDAGAAAGGAADPSPASAGGGVEAVAAETAASCEVELDEDARAGHHLWRLESGNDAIASLGEQLWFGDGEGKCCDFKEYGQSYERRTAFGTTVLSFVSAFRKYYTCYSGGEMCVCLSIIFIQLSICDPHRS